MTNGHTSPPLLKLAELPLMKVSANDVAPARECVAQRKFVGQVLVGCLCDCLLGLCWGCCCVACRVAVEC